MINSTQNHNVQLAAWAKVLLAPQGTCACGPLPLPRRNVLGCGMRHNARGRGENTRRGQRIFQPPVQPQSN